MSSTLRTGKLTSSPRALMPRFAPEAMCRCATLSMGVTLAPLTQAAEHIEHGTLVRILPAWHADVGTVSLYFSGQRLLPAKTPLSWTL